MTPAHKTAGILALAGAVTAGALLLTRSAGGTGAPDADPDPATARAGGLELTAYPESSHVLSGLGETHLAVTLEAPAPERQVRPQLDLAIVLDRSGSMHGEKLAQAKSAARQLITRLDPRDRFSVTVYGSEVEVVVPARQADERAVAEAVRRIDAIYDDGGTNLSGGLLAGRAELLEPGEREATRARVSRIVLISDGRANEGVIDREKLVELARSTARRGVSITTLGVGLDFDETLMTDVAVAGHGNYYFAESASMLAQLFDRELERIGATVATDAIVSVRPARGVQVLEAYGYPTSPGEGAGAVTLPVADLHAGESRKIVLRLRVDAPRRRALELARVRVDFTPTRSRGRRSAEVLARAAITDDPAVVAQGRRAEAVRHIERARTAVAIDEATALFEKGERDGALRVLQEREAAATAAARSVGADDLAEDLEEATGQAQGFMEKAPQPFSEAGRRGLKKSRARSYELKF